LCFEEHFILFSLVTALNFIPVKGILLLWDIDKICISIFFLRYSLLLKWDGMHMWFLFLLSFIAKDIEHFLMYFLTSCTCALRTGTLFRNESIDCIPGTRSAFLISLTYGNFFHLPPSDRQLSIHLNYCTTICLLLKTTYLLFPLKS
jgi:hypothetical protein